MNAIKVTLGQELKKAREINGFTLRDVENSIGISNAYLSQMENDKIKNPSANILYKLASLYEIIFEELLEKAGVISDSPKNSKKTLSGSALYSKNLTSEEEAALTEYLRFIRFDKRKNG